MMLGARMLLQSSPPHEAITCTVAARRGIVFFSPCCRIRRPSLLAPRAPPAHTGNVSSFSSSSSSYCNYRALAVVMSDGGMLPQGTAVRLVCHSRIVCGHRSYGTSAGGAQPPPPHDDHSNDAWKKGLLKSDTTKGPGTSVTFIQKAKEAGKDVTYALTIAGVFVFILLVGYTLIDKQYGATSEQRVFARSSSLIQADPEVRKLLGDRVMCRGDDSSRRRRGLHVERYNHPKTNQKHTRVEYIAEGELNKSLVTAEVNSSGAFVYIAIAVPTTGERLRYTGSKFVRTNM